MKVEIFSLTAAVSGHPYGTTWQGDVPDAWFEGNLDGEEGALSMVFRYFNRVNKRDEIRMEKAGYRLPSLSMGDFITIQGGTRPLCYDCLQIDGVEQVIEYRLGAWNCPVHQDRCHVEFRRDGTKTFQVVARGFKEVTGETLLTAVAGFLNV